MAYTEQERYIDVAWVGQTYQECAGYSKYVARLQRPLLICRDSCITQKPLNHSPSTCRGASVAQEREGSRHMQRRILGALQEQHAPDTVPGQSQGPPVQVSGSHWLSSSSAGDTLEACLQIFTALHRRYPHAACRPACLRLRIAASTGRALVYILCTIIYLGIRAICYPFWTVHVHAFMLHSSQHNATE